MKEQAEVVRDKSDKPGRERLVLTAALLGFFMISLDATAVNVALPALTRIDRNAGV